MACHYNIIHNSQTGYYYPIAVNDGSTMSTKEFLKRVTKRCTVTRADAGAVFTASVEVLNEVLTGGRAVKLDGLGTLRLKITSTGVTSLADFDVNKQVTAVRIQLTPERELNSNGAYERELVDSTDLEWVLSASSKYTPGETTTTAASSSETESSVTEEAADTGDTSETESSSEGATSEEQA